MQTASDGGALGSDTNKDVGIAMQYHTGSAAKQAFLGIDDSDSYKLMFIPDASLSSEVVSGSVGTIKANLEGDVTGDVTGNTSGTAATVTGAAQSNITSLGTLTTLTVDNVIVNGTTIGHTSDTDLLTLTSANLAVAGDIEVSGSVEVATIDYTDGDLAMTIADGGGVTFAQDATFSGDVALADDKVINLGEAGKIDFGDEAPADNAATGIVFSFIAGTTLAIGDVVYMHTDGEVAKADADAVTSMPAIGICVGAGTDGNAVDVLVQGIMHDTSAFDTFTVGADIFVSTTAGAVTATAPSGSGDTVQKVGVALHADMVYFNFNTTEVLLA